MKARPKILHCDDDPDLLDVYREVLAALPSQLEVRKADSGPRALAMLEAEPGAKRVLSGIVLHALATQYLKRID
jgi:CheY-like chemotaxis protein